MKYMVAGLCLWASCGWAVPEVTLFKHALTQGGFVVGQTEAGAQVTANGSKVFVGDDGAFVLGFERFAAPTQRLQVCKAKACKDVLLQLTTREYDVQHVKGVPSKTVNPDQTHLKRAADDTKAIKASRAQLKPQASYLTTWRLPVEGARISGVFGSRRTFNGEERSWHKGHDFAAPTGTPVVAPAAGVVRLARDTFFNGNLVIVDHGHHLTSLYAHLDSMTVKIGQTVAQGDKLGEVGSTGRSTGPHLHWGINWYNTAIDPALWLGHTLTQGE